MYRKGSYNVTCDRCGHSVRAERTRMEWTGHRMCTECWESKNIRDEKFPVPTDNYTIDGSQIRLEPALLFDSDNIVWETQQSVWEVKDTNWEDA